MDEADELLTHCNENLNDITPPAILRFTSSEVSEANREGQEVPGNFEPKDLVDSACLLTSEENSNIDNSSKMAEISINDVLCYPDDLYPDMDITVHEFGHSLHWLGFAQLWPEFQVPTEKYFMI